MEKRTGSEETMMSELGYVEHDGKTQYGDYIKIDQEPKGEELKKLVLLLTEQMLDTMESVNVDISGKPITFIITSRTIGWKILV